MHEVIRPKILSKTLALVPPTVLLVAQQVDAGTMFLKIGSITGESTEANHKDWIDVSSCEFSVARPASIDPKTGTLISTGAATAQPIKIDKLLDKASPQLFLACAQGTTQTQAVLEVTDGLGTLYYRVTLDVVLISSISSSSGGERPAESVELNFGKLRTEYFINGKLTTSALYDFAAGK